MVPSCILLEQIDPIYFMVSSLMDNKNDVNSSGTQRAADELFHYQETVDQQLNHRHSKIFAVRLSQKSLLFALQLVSEKFSQVKIYRLPIVSSMYISRIAVTLSKNFENQQGTTDSQNLSTALNRIALHRFDVSS